LLFELSLLIPLKNHLFLEARFENPEAECRDAMVFGFALALIFRLFYFSSLFPDFFALCTHRSCAQPVCNAGCRLAPCAFISQTIRLIQRLALQAAPMK
jgi:hypothetical protein